MDNILSSAMAEEEIKKAEARNEEIAKNLEERKASFDEEKDIEAREKLIKDVEALKEEQREISEKIAELRKTYEEMKGKEQSMDLLNNVNPSVVEGRNEQVDYKSTEEYCEVWAEYAKTNQRSAFSRYTNADATTEKEVRTLATSVANIPVPTILQTAIETAWVEYGKLSRLVTKSYIKGLLSIPYEATATGANWHAEGSEAPAEEEITFGSLSIEPMMIKKWISLTDELLALTGSDFVRYIADELVYRVVLKLDEAIINGTLTNGKGVLGITKDSNVPAIKKSASFNVVNEALAELKFVNDVCVVLNPKTFFDTMMGLTDTTGRPIYSVAMDNTMRPKYYLNGLPVEFTDALPAYSTATANQDWMVVGNLKAFRLNMPNGDGVDTMTDPYTKATEDIVRFIGKLFAGGRVTKFGRLVRVQKSA